MLVMMLRTVTFEAPWRWCSSRTTWSESSFCSCSSSSSHSSAGVTPGSWSRRRCTSCTANAGSGRRLARQRSSALVHGLAVDAQQPVGERVGFLARGAADDDALRDAAQVLHQHDAQRDGHRPQLADGQRLDASDRRARSDAVSRARSGCRCARRRPRRCRTPAEIRRTVLPPAWAAGGRNPAAGPRGSRESAPRRRGSCRAPIRRPA